MPAKCYSHRGAARLILLLWLVLSLFWPAMMHRALARTALVAPIGQRSVVASVATLVTVTTTAETVDGNTADFASLNSQAGLDGVISLREALLAANGTAPGPAITIAFTLPVSDSGHRDGVWTITLGFQALPALNRGGVTIDGATQVSTARAPIAIDGINVYEAEGLNNGLTLASAGNTIRGLRLLNFYDAGVLISGSSAANNRVLGCDIVRNSATGIELRDGAHDNQIGDGAAGSRNRIAGNGYYAGIYIRGTATQSNTIIGNWIGVDTTGQVAEGNVFAGVRISGGARNNRVGGASAGAGNVISGNDKGIYIEGSASNTITGNLIGLAADGRSPLGNRDGGVFVVGGARDNVIGGVTAGSRNVISSNGNSLAPERGEGIYIVDAGSDNNRIQGNYIGVDASGILPRGNSRQGILVGTGAQGNRIGGTEAGAGNVIAYNGLGGIRIDASANQVAGNLIGIGADGQTPLGNQQNGVRIRGDNNIIGPDNRIANSQHSAIMLSGSGTSVISNTLANNARSGICVAGPNTTITGNQITANGGASGAWPDCNIQGGVVITGTNNALVNANAIHDNSNAGVFITGGSGNRILTNSISGNTNLGIQLTGGGNNEISPPRILRISLQEVSGIGCPLCVIEIFTDTGDQGSDFVGRTVAGSDGSFTLSLGPQIANGPHVTATHTDSSGNTSPFADAVTMPPREPAPQTYRVYLAIMKTSTGGNQNQPPAVQRR